MVVEIAARFQVPGIEEDWKGKQAEPWPEFKAVARGV